MRVALWYTAGRQIIGAHAAGVLPGQQRQPARHADHRLLRAGDLARPVGRRPNICRSAATSTPSAPTRKRRRAQRHPGPAATSSAPSWRRVRSPPWPASCWPRGCSIGQASVGLEYLLPALVGAFLGSTTIKPGPGQCLGHHRRRRRSWRSASPASSSSAAPSGSSRCSTASRSRSPSASPAGPGAAAAAPSSGSSRYRITTDRPAGRHARGELSDASIADIDRAAVSLLALAASPGGPRRRLPRPGQGAP